MVFPRLTFLTLLHRPNTILKLLNVVSNPLCFPRHIQRLARQDLILACRLDIQARRKRPLARPAEHHDADLRVHAQLLKGMPKLEPDLLRKGVELLRAVDLDVGDKRRGRADEDVLVGAVLRHRRCG